MPGYIDFHDRAAAFTFGDGQRSFAHHFKPFAYICERDMRFVVVLRAEARSGVGNAYLDAVLTFSGLNPDGKRIEVGIDAVLDGIFHDGLQGQRRQSEARVRRIEFNEQLSFKAYLLIVCSTSSVKGIVPSFAIAVKFFLR